MANSLCSQAVVFIPALSERFGVIAVSWLLMLIFILSSATASLVSPTASFTLRDQGNDGTVDRIDDTDDGSGFFGSISNASPSFSGAEFTDEHFFEFSLAELAGGAIQNLSIGIWNPNSQIVEISLAYYVGTGSTNTEVFGVGTHFQTLTHTGNADPFRLMTFEVDIQPIAEALVSTGHEYLGFRLYDVYHENGGRGDQARYESSSVVPEPSAFLLGGFLCSMFGVKFAYGLRARSGHKYGACEA